MPTLPYEADIYPDTLPMNTLVVENMEDQWKVSVKGKDLSSVGSTVPEAVGNLVILFGNQLGIKLEAK